MWSRKIPLINQPCKLFFDNRIKMSEQWSSDSLIIFIGRIDISGRNLIGDGLIITGCYKGFGDYLK